MPMTMGYQMLSLHRGLAQTVSAPGSVYGPRPAGGRGMPVDAVAVRDFDLPGLSALLDIAFGIATERLNAAGAAP